MISICKNCNHPVESPYCGQCGQNVQTHPINAHFLWHDIQHGFFHFDKGILFTLKELFTRPGFTIKDYLNGKRVQHFRPLSLIIILAGIWSLFYHYMPVSLQEIPNGKAMTGAKIMQWLRNHYSIAELINLPFYALASYLVFKTYNYWEHLVINAFLIAQKTAVGIVFLPILYSINDKNIQMITSGFISIICFFLLYWGYVQIFSSYSKMKVFLLTLLVYIILIAETLSISLVFSNF